MTEPRAQRRPIIPPDNERGIETTTASVPFFFKQVGGRTPKAGGHLLDGTSIQEFPS